MSAANHIILIAGMGTSPVSQTSYYNKWSEVCLRRVRFRGCERVLGKELTSKEN